MAEADGKRMFIFNRESSGSDEQDDEKKSDAYRSKRQYKLRGCRLSTVMKPRSYYWGLACDDRETDENGDTEADVVMASLNLLYEQNGELFAKPPEKFQFPEKTYINCFNSDPSDVNDILKVANEIRDHVNFPYLIYYFGKSRKVGSLYMHTPDGEFYSSSNSNWVLYGSQ